ncbi:hypothetical protein OAD66_00620 [Bacteroidia bacterium]|nr:hypothetical protein [Bacteroidia bacterium]MDB9881629.1 hypothetical protein [Bacteroidia bacterium]
MQESINYERKIFDGKSVELYGLIGAGNGVNFYTDKNPVGPGGLAAITLLTGKKNNHFEMNTGLFVGNNQDNNTIHTIPTFSVGYRYQEPQGGGIFRVKVGILEIGFGIDYAF